MIHRRVASVTALLAVLASTTGCGPSITAPDVLGMRLDEAHRTFEALDVDEFEDVDVIGDNEAIMWDANWVVVAQDPAAGTKDVDTDTKIRLEVGNQDDPEVLEMIPPDSPFAQEMVPDEDPEPTSDPPPSSDPSPTDDPTLPGEKPSHSGKPRASTTPQSATDTEIAACVDRKGNPGEIYVWYSYGNDQPPDATRLGAGYVWSFGSKECVTTAEFALRSNPPLPGYCTVVGKVASNPGYRVDARPAPRIPYPIGAAGDC